MGRTRADFIGAAGSAVAFGAISSRPGLAASPPAVKIDVAYAGSMATVLEGPLRTAAARRLSIDVQGRAQGASGLAKMIVEGTIAPDAFISVTPGPMRSVLAGGKAARAIPIARTEMVLAYAPGSRFAARFRDAGKAGKPPWYEVLQDPRLRFGRSDPITDPLGRNAIFTLMLAEIRLGVPGLRARVLGPDENPEQIFTESTIAERLQSGQIDAALTYKIQPVPFKLPYLSLPASIDLGAEAQAADYAQVGLVLEKRTFRPEPLVYYAAVLGAATHASEAAAFINWLAGHEAQAIFRQYGYDDAAAAPALHA